MSKKRKEGNDSKAINEVCFRCTILSFVFDKKSFGHNCHNNQIKFTNAVDFKILDFCLDNIFLKYFKYLLGELFNIKLNYNFYKQRASL